VFRSEQSMVTAIVHTVYVKSLLLPAPLIRALLDYVARYKFIYVCMYVCMTS